MTISARIILDSVNPVGCRLTTWELTYPRFIHSEFMTHRVFSRNAASSRAIPIKRMVDSVLDDPAEPIWWGRNVGGMQAPEELSDVPLLDVDTRTNMSPRAQARRVWLEARDRAVDAVTTLAALGLHKQIVNRVIEPWMHITVVATATDHRNFFKLRAHRDAQPEFQRLAYLMRDMYEGNRPTQIAPGGWHVPYTDEHDWDAEPVGMVILKVGVARCARVSYVRQNERREPERDVELCDRLSSSGHWSPFEHVARALPTSERVGNFHGWRQYRKDFPGEAGGDM